MRFWMLGDVYQAEKIRVTSKTYGPRAREARARSNFQAAPPQKSQKKSAKISRPSSMFIIVKFIVMYGAMETTLPPGHKIHPTTEVLKN